MILIKYLGKKPLSVLQNGSQVMLVVLSGHEVAYMDHHDEEVSAVSKTREAAELLSSRAEEGMTSIHVKWFKKEVMLLAEEISQANKYTGSSFRL